VALTKPDLIGLQEVYDFTVNGSNIGPPFVNHLDETLSALAAKGQSYQVAATLNNLDITVPIDGLGMVRVLDRDVILAREGVEVTSLSGDYSSGGLCGVRIRNPAFGLLGPEFLESTPSEEGCNFTIFLEIPSQFGSTIKVERGFVGIDAKVRGKTYRFVDTHFEQKLPDPNNPDSAIFQSLQAAELVGTLIATTPPDLNLVLLGDFNSWSEDAPIAGITPPYQIIIGAGFADAWDTNPLARFDKDGLTCCEFSDLSNVTSDHYERVDIIFVRDTSFFPLAFVTGKIPIFPLSQPPNWASDHGGVFAKLIFK
jgi:endonuclease/exonuclease/phosphatase family metal-dependent hydrolase